MQPTVNPCLCAGPACLDARPGGRGCERKAVPGLCRHIAQEAKGGANPADFAHQLRELVHKFARTNDQRADPRADQGSTQKDQCCGEALHGEGRTSQPRDPTSHHDRRKSCGIGCEPSKIVKDRRDRLAQNARATGRIAKRIGDGFQRRRDGRREAIGKAEPDQAELGNRIPRPFDLCRIGRAHGHPEVAHVLGRLSQRGGINPQKRKCSPVAEEI